MNLTFDLDREFRAQDRYDKTNLITGIRTIHTILLCMRNTAVVRVYTAVVRYHPAWIDTTISLCGRGPAVRVDIVVVQTHGMYEYSYRSAATAVL